MPPGLYHILLDSVKKHTFFPHPSSDEDRPSQASFPCTFSNKECTLQLHKAQSSTYPFYIALQSSFITHIIKFPEDALKKRNKKISKADNEGVSTTKVTNLNLDFISLATQVKVTRKSLNSPENRALVYALPYLHLPVSTAPL